MKISTISSGWFSVEFCMAKKDGYHIITLRVVRLVE